MPINLSDLMVKIGGDSHEAVSAIKEVSVALAGMEIAAAKGAADIESTLVHLQNEFGLTQKEADALRVSIIKMARETGASMDSLAESYAHARGAGFDAAGAMNVVEAAMKNAIATGGDTKTITTALATAMHQFGVNANQAGQAMDALHEASIAGGRGFDSFLSGFRPAAALATTFGVSLQDTAGAIAAFERSGLEGRRAGALFKQTITEIISPSAKLRDELTALGRKAGVDLVKEFSTTGIHAKGLGGIVDDVSKAVGGNRDALIHYFPELKESQGLILLAGKAHKDFADAVRESGDALSETTPKEDAFNRAMATFHQQVKVLEQELETNFLPLGNDLLTMLTDAKPTIEAVIHGADGLVKGFMGLPEPLRHTAEGLTLVAGGISLVGKALAILGVEIEGGILRKVIGGGKGLVGGIASVLGGAIAGGTGWGAGALTGVGLVAGGAIAAGGGATYLYGKHQIGVAEDQIGIAESRYGGIWQTRALTDQYRNNPNWKGWYNKPFGTGGIAEGALSDATRMEMMGVAKKRFPKAGSLEDLSAAQLDELAGIRSSQLSAGLGARLVPFGGGRLAEREVSRLDRLPPDIRALISGRMSSGQSTGSVHQGTHVSGDAFDVSIRGLSAQVIQTMREALASVGIRSAIRTPGELYPGSPLHLHAAGPGGTSNFARLPREVGPMTVGGGGASGYIPTPAERDLMNQLHIEAMEGRKQEEAQAKENWRQNRIRVMTTLTDTKAQHAGLRVAEEAFHLAMKQIRERYQKEAETERKRAADKLKTETEKRNTEIQKVLTDRIKLQLQGIKDSIAQTQAEADQEAAKNRYEKEKESLALQAMPHGPGKLAALQTLLGQTQTAGKLLEPTDYAGLTENLREVYSLQSQIAEQQAVINRATKEWDDALAKAQFGELEAFFKSAAEDAKATAQYSAEFAKGLESAKLGQEKVQQFLDEQRPVTSRGKADIRNRDHISTLLFGDKNPYASLDPLLKGIVDHWMETLLSNRVKDRMKTFWARLRQDADKEFKTAGTSFFENLLSGRLTFKKAFQALLLDMKQMIVRALANILVEEMSTKLRALLHSAFGGSGKSAQTAGAPTNLSEFWQQALGGVQDSGPVAAGTRQVKKRFGELDNVLAQGGGILSYGIGHLGNILLGLQIGQSAGGKHKGLGGFFGALLGVGLAIATGGSSLLYGAVGGTIGAAATGENPLSGLLQGVNVASSLPKGTPPIVKGSSFLRQANGVALSPAMVGAGSAANVTIYHTHNGDINTPTDDNNHYAALGRSIQSHLRSRV